MAPGSRLRRSPRRNPPTDSADNKLADAPPRAPTKSSGSPAPTSQAPSYAPTLGPALALALGPAPIVAPTSTKELCQQLMKTYAATVKLLEQNQAGAGQVLGPRERSLKARFPETYSSNSDMECYKFCQ